MKRWRYNQDCNHVFAVIFQNTIYGRRQRRYIIGCICRESLSLSNTFHTVVKREDFLATVLGFGEYVDDSQVLIHNHSLVSASGEQFSLRSATCRRAIALRQT